MQDGEERNRERERKRQIMKNAFLFNFDSKNGEREEREKTRANKVNHQLFYNFFFCANVCISTDVDCMHTFFFD